MTVEQRDQLERLFAEAVTLPPDCQKAFIAENSRDPEVSAELETLLFFDAGRPPTGIAEMIEQAADSLTETALVGQRVGPYRLMGRIGQGGMGTVCRAVRDDDQFQQTVVIKLLRFAQGEPVEIQRFRRERQILASLEHPHIARLLDGGAWLPPGSLDSQPYIVMEYVEGLSLIAHCEQKKLSLRQRLLLFREVCDALSYAHRRLIIHRDIKPDNILVTADGAPKLLDFGIAKLMDPEIEPGTGPIAQTATGQRAMTPEYASPEQFRGDPVSTVTDVYSLGAVLYEMLTGRRAHQLLSGDPSEIVREICEREMQPPSVVGGRELRGDLDVIVLKAMQRSLHDATNRWNNSRRMSGAIWRDCPSSRGRTR
jgi:serine/threonine protein kinase